MEDFPESLWLAGYLWNSPQEGADRITQTEQAGTVQVSALNLSPLVQPFVHPPQSWVCVHLPFPFVTTVFLLRLEIIFTKLTNDEESNRSEPRKQSWVKKMANI